MRCMNWPAVPQSANRALAFIHGLGYCARLMLAADVAELADALDSKSGIRKGVWVRPPPSAPTESTTCVELIDMLLQCCYTVAHEIELFAEFVSD